MMPDQFTVVLIRPKGPFNIGATCRAMQNMGIDRLVIVNPKTEIDVHAREGAASAQAILARRIVYESMQEFLSTEGDGLRIAFTRRDGHKRGFLTLDPSVKITSRQSSTPTTKPLQFTLCLDPKKTDSITKKLNTPITA